MPDLGQRDARLTRSYGPLRAGNHWVNWPKICEYFGWDRTKLCGPVVCSFSKAAEGREKNCPGGHTAHCKQPQVKGKPFSMEAYKDELVELGLCGPRDELKALKGKPPPGQPKKVNGVNVYPAMHFA